MGATGSKATSAGLPPVNAPVDSRQISTPAGPAPPAAAPAVSEASSAALKPEAVSEGKTSAAAALATVAPAAAAPIAETATADAAAVAAAAAREQRLRAAELEARARVLSSKVRCVECGHQSIEESNADVAIFMRKMIRDELRAGRQEGEILESLKSEYGDSVVYSPPFHGASAALWLTPVNISGLSEFTWGAMGCHGVPWGAMSHSAAVPRPSPPLHPAPLVAASTRCLCSQQQPHPLCVNRCLCLAGEAEAAYLCHVSSRHCPSSAPPGPSCCCLHQVFVLAAAAASAVRRRPMAATTAAAAAMGAHAAARHAHAMPRRAVRSKQVCHRVVCVHNAQSCDAIACTVICATPIAAFLAPTGV
ncbi:unnamed protein product [Closterium sp. NIES-64]|nr:unnamed protein product [Closterium sp. NIES-64]